MGCDSEEWMLERRVGKKEIQQQQGVSKIETVKWNRKARHRGMGHPSSWITPTLKESMSPRSIYPRGKQNEHFMFHPF